MGKYIQKRGSSTAVHQSRGRQELEARLPSSQAGALSSLFCCILQSRALLQVTLSSVDLRNPCPKCPSPFL